MKVLVINCGSSSLKYQLIDMEGEKVLCKGLCERIGMESSMITHEANGHKATTPAIFPTHTEAFTEVVKKMTTGEGKVIDSVSEIDAIGHRVVHGGEKFKESCLITPEVVKAIHDLSPLAPLHNPAAILGIEASYKVFGQDKPNVAVFDTAFHSTMPPKAYMYAIPYEYYEIRKEIRKEIPNREYRRTARPEKTIADPSTEPCFPAYLSARCTGSGSECGRRLLLQAEPGRHLYAGLRSHDAAPPCLL